MPYHGSEDTMGGEGWWRPTMGPAELDTMVGLRDCWCAQPWVQLMLDTMVGGVACCHGVKDHHGDGPWIKVTCCPGVKDHQDDGSWIIVRLVPYHGSEDTMGGEGWWRPPMGPAELDAMVGYETAGVPNHGSS